MKVSLIGCELTLDPSIDLEEPEGASANDPPSRDQAWNAIEALHHPVTSPQAVLSNRALSTFHVSGPFVLSI